MSIGVGKSVFGGLGVFVGLGGSVAVDLCVGSEVGGRDVLVGLGVSVLLGRVGMECVFVGNLKSVGVEVIGGTLVFVGLGVFVGTITKVGVLLRTMESLVFVALGITIS